MKKLISMVLALSLLLTPTVISAESEQASSQPPPVAQPLVREGEFAMKLVEVMGKGPATSEAEAENMLSSMGVAPLQGWIADYPVTPQVIAQLQNAMITAVNSNKLLMEKDEALKALQTVTAEFGLPVVADTTSQYTQTEPPKDYGQHYTPGVVNNYYYEQGPPVVTYYPPPWDYSYLYRWVPSPFFFSSFFFPGFFILHDFNRIFIRANKVVIVKNHVFDPITKKVVVVDPGVNVRQVESTRRGTTFKKILGSAVRSDERIIRSNTERANTGGFRSIENQRAAASIIERSRERALRDNSGRARTLDQGTVTRGTLPSRSERGGAESVTANRSGNFSNFPRIANSPPSPVNREQFDRRNLFSGSGRDSENRVFRPGGDNSSISNRQATSPQRSAIPEPRVRREQNVIPQQNFNSMGNIRRSFESRGRSFSLPNTISRENRQTFSPPAFNASRRGGESSFNTSSKGGQAAPSVTQRGGGHRGMERSRASRGR